MAIDWEKPMVFSNWMEWCALFGDKWFDTYWLLNPEYHSNISQLPFGTQRMAIAHSCVRRRCYIRTIHKSRFSSQPCFIHMKSYEQLQSMKWDFGIAYLQTLRTQVNEKVLGWSRVNYKYCKSISMYIYNISGWWFGTLFIFPYIGNNHPNWLIFFRGVETTNQIYTYTHVIYTILIWSSPAVVLDSKHGPFSCQDICRTLTLSFSRGHNFHLAVKFSKFQWVKSCHVVKMP